MRFNRLTSPKQFPDPDLDIGAHQRAISAGGDCRCGKKSKPVTNTFPLGAVKEQCARCRGDNPGQRR